MVNLATIKITTMKQFIIALGFVFFTISNVTGQWELVETVDAYTIAANFGVPAAFDVEAYKVEYPTTNIDGTPGVASGLLCVPINNDSRFPMMIYQHGTVNDRNDVPSNLAGGYQLGQLFCSLGFTVLMPDYLGLGVNPGVHPYVHADSEAWVSLDMMREVRDNLGENIPERYLNDQVFISGYSQGGHASMALQRLLEAEHADEFPVTAASHMSGPYSISEAMIDFTLGEEEYNFFAYLASATISAKAAFPTLLADFEIEDVFKPQYVDLINDFADEVIDLNTLNAGLGAGLLDDVGVLTPKDLLLPGIVDALKDDPTHPLSQAMQMNDVFDWAPQVPTRMMYCSGDDQVTFENAILAEEVMLANGAVDLEAQEHGATLDHGGCVVPATTATAFFFFAFRQVLSSTGELLDNPLAQMSAAQFENDLHVIVDPAMLDLNNPQFILTDINGRHLIVDGLDRDQFTVDLSEINSGIYAISLMANGQILETQKLFIK